MGKTTGQILNLNSHRRGRWLLGITSKPICIGVAILLCFSLFAGSLMAAPDCDARCCCSAMSQVGARHAMPMKIQSSQSCCGGNAPMPCDIQNAQPHELPDALFTSSHNLNLPTMASLVGQNAVAPATDQSTCARHADSINHHFRSPPLYLSNLTILA